MLLLLFNHTTGARKRNTRVGNKRRYHPQILGCPHSIVTELSTCQRSEIPNLRSSTRQIREKKHDVFTWAEVSAGHSLGRFLQSLDKLAALRIGPLRREQQQQQRPPKTQYVVIHGCGLLCTKCEKLNH